MISRIFKHKEIAFIYKFITVGLICSVVFYVIYASLLFFKVQYQLASIIGYMCGTVTSYFLNKMWTFQSKEAHSVVQASKFITVYLIALSVNLGVLTLLVSHFQMNKLFSEVFAIGFSAIFSYLGNRFIVF